jgi:hypothetical protein
MEAPSVLMKAVFSGRETKADFYCKILSESKIVYRKKDGKYIGEEVKYSVKSRIKGVSRSIDEKL